MSEPISLAMHRPLTTGGSANSHIASTGNPLNPSQVNFDRQELQTLLNLYSFRVADGEWRDYAIDFGRDRAVFSVFRKAREAPLFRVEKQPKLAKRQGAWSVIDQSGRVLKRGHDLAQVLRVLRPVPKLVR